MSKEIYGNIVGVPNPKPDWNQTDETMADYIKNKPDVIVASEQELTPEQQAQVRKNIGITGDGTSVTHSWDGTTLTITSASGTSSADLKGEKGDRGERGDKGDQGAQGEKGDKGDPGQNAPQEAILYTKQNLTPEQQAQARENIGITNDNDASNDFIIYAHISVTDNKFVLDTSDAYKQIRNAVDEGKDVMLHLDLHTPQGTTVGVFWLMPLTSSGGGYRFASVVGEEIHSVLIDYTGKSTYTITKIPTDIPTDTGAMIVTLSEGWKTASHNNIQIYEHIQNGGTVVLTTGYTFYPLSEASEYHAVFASQMDDGANEWFEILEDCTVNALSLSLVQTPALDNLVSIYPQELTPEQRMIVRQNIGLEGIDDLDMSGKEIMAERVSVYGSIEARGENAKITMFAGGTEQENNEYLFLDSLMGNPRISGVGRPIYKDDVAIKSYVDSKCLVVSWVFGAPIASHTSEHIYDQVKNGGTAVLKIAPDSYDDRGEYISLLESQETVAIFAYISDEGFCYVYELSDDGHVHFYEFNYESRDNKVDAIDDSTSPFSYPSVRALRDYVAENSGSMSAKIDDDVLVVTPTGGSGGSGSVDYATPQMFGAKGDGVTDDSNAIQQAIDSVTGGVIYFPKGTYRLESPILVKSNLRLIGSGINQTVIKPIGCHGFTCTKGEYLVYFEMRDLTIEGDFEGELGDDIEYNPNMNAINFDSRKADSDKVREVHNCWFENIWIRKVRGKGIYIPLDFNNTFTNVNIMGIGGNCFEVRGWVHDNFTDCSVGHIQDGYCGFRIYQKAFLLRCNGLFGKGDYVGIFGKRNGLFLDDSTDVSESQYYVAIDSCNFEDFSKYAIYAIYAGGFDIRNSVFMAKPTGTFDNYIYAEQLTKFSTIDGISEFYSKGAVKNNDKISGPITTNSASQVQFLSFGKRTAVYDEIHKMNIGIPYVYTTYEWNNTGAKNKLHLSYAAIDEMTYFKMGGKKHTYGEAAPTSGDWAIGDIVYNTNPLHGTPTGWICRKAGSPGVWEVMGQCGIATYAELPAAGAFLGQRIFNTSDEKFYTWCEYISQPSGELVKKWIPS